VVQHAPYVARGSIAAMQIDRILQHHGFGTRKGCRALVRAERVMVNGVLCDDPFAEFATENLVFSVDGVEWPYQEFATLIINKPAGYECSRKPQHHPSVLDLLPVPLRERGVQPIGRLDEDTTGLLLITDDGQLNHQLSSGKRKVPKVYLATTKHPLDAAQIDQLLAGVLLNDEPEPVAAAGAEIVGDCLLKLTVTEGKYHQVKRMVAAAGNRVEALHRESVGGLTLPADLKPGEWRWLSPVDRENLQKTS
jgi:16S rRNA pseudouridine516 synthase